MNKNTIHLSSPCYLRTQNEQLVIEIKPAYDQEKIIEQRPLEDLGCLILENPQITLSHSLLSKCMQYNIAVVTTDDKHLPNGLFLNLHGNSVQSKRFQAQLAASEPLKKQLWQQTIQAKILNQAKVLELVHQPFKILIELADSVRSGDADNYEAQAANYYWSHIFAQFFNFTRDQEGEPPNNLLNYGYAILRAIVARSLVGSGLLPTLGIFHRNQYNAYCLADDMMEPYRPVLDLIVYNLVSKHKTEPSLTKDKKAPILNLPYLYMQLNKEKISVFNAILKTTSSLSKCFEGGQRKLVYPELLFF